MLVCAANAQTSFCHSSFSCSQATQSNFPIIPAGSGAWSQLYNTGGFTWEAWVRLRGPIKNQSIIISTEDAVPYQDVFLGFGWGSIPDALCFHITDDGASNTMADAESLQALTVNTWYHVAGVCDYANAIMRLYLNGVQIAAKAIPANILAHRLSQNHSTFIGNASASASGSDMDIDEARFWNTARTQSEIQSSITACLTLPQTGLVAYFKADGGSEYTKSAVDANFSVTPQNASVAAGAPVDDCYMVSINETSAACKSFGFNGSVSSGGITVLAWSWDYGDANTGSGQNTSHTYSAYGTEHVTLNVKDNAGCGVTIAKDIDITKPDLGGDQEYTVCPGTKINLVQLYNISPYKSVDWNTPTPADEGAGAWQLIVTDLAGCKDTAEVVIKEYPVISTVIDASLCAGGSYAGYTTSGTYADHFTAFNGCDSLRTLHLTVLPRYNTVVDTAFCETASIEGYTRPGSYTDHFTSTGGCDSIRTLNIGVCEIFFPGAFTPNGDGNNDLFKAVNATGLDNYHLQIYNRWGQLVFQSSDPGKGWDGTANDKPAPQGAYIWYCEYAKKGKPQRSKLKGTTLLIR